MARNTTRTIVDIASETMRGQQQISAFYAHAYASQRTALVSMIHQRDQEPNPHVRQQLDHVIARTFTHMNRDSMANARHGAVEIQNLVSSLNQSVIAPHHKVTWRDKVVAWLTESDIESRNAPRRDPSESLWAELDRTRQREGDRTRPHQSCSPSRQRTF